METEKNIHDSIKLLGNLTNQYAEKRASWSQHILLLSSTLFGILISLHDTHSDKLYIRLVFALAVAFLGIGILLTALAVYSHIDAVKRARKVAVEESQDALRKHRAMNTVTVPERKIFLFCESAGYVCLVLSVLLLSLYAVLPVFNCF